MEFECLSWLEYGMAMALTASLRSKDPSTKVGAVIMNGNNRIIGTGLNGFPPGFPDTSENWQRPQKYGYVVHAEMNAIFNCMVPITDDCKLVCTLRPCDNCTKHICATKIKEVYYLEHKSGDIFTNSFKLFHESGVKVTHTRKMDVEKILNMIVKWHFGGKYCVNTCSCEK